MQSFTELFMSYTSDAESPKSFFRWASYSAVAAVLRDSVYLDLGFKKVWPNIYVVLMARSAALRKSVPVELVADLLTQVGNTKIMMGRSSIQAVIKELGTTETGADGKPMGGASGIIISGELAAFSPEDPATIPLLTDLYDNHKKWSSNLVSAGKTKLENTCVNLLAATNEPFFREVYNLLAIRGGLLGRTFIVREEKKSQSNSLMFLEFEDLEALKKYLRERYDTTLLVSRLRALAQIKGQVVMEYDARVEYDKWYKSLDGSRIGDTGVVERIHTGVLKVALLLAVGEMEGLCVRKRHVEDSILQCVELLKNYEVITMSAGKSEQAEPSALFITYLWENGGYASHQSVLRDNWRHFDQETLGKLVTTLVQAGLVLEKLRDAAPGYELTDKGRAIFEKGKK